MQCWFQAETLLSCGAREKPFSSNEGKKYIRKRHVASPGKAYSKTAATRHSQLCPPARRAARGFPTPVPPPQLRVKSFSCFLGSSDSISYQQQLTLLPKLGRAGEQVPSKCPCKLPYFVVCTRGDTARGAWGRVSRGSCSRKVNIGI